MSLITFIMKCFKASWGGWGKKGLEGSKVAPFIFYIVTFLGGLSGNFKIFLMKVMKRIYCVKSYEKKAACMLANDVT